MNMKILIEKKHVVWVFGYLSLFSTLFVISFLTFILPLNNQYTFEQQQLFLESEILKAVQSEKINEQEKVIYNLNELQSRVPIEPNLDQLLLSLSKAETISNTLILNMNLTEDFISSEYLMNDDNEAQETKQNNNADIKKITISIQAQSPSYDNMILFLKEIEDLKRLTKIDSFSFKGPREKVLASQEIQNELLYSLTISTYYVPSLKGAFKHLPTEKIGEPGNKKNPLLNTR